MGETLRTWLYSLLLSGCICSLILYLNPDGKMKSLLETGCAIVMMLTFLSPISKWHSIDFNISEFDQWTTFDVTAAASDNLEEYKERIIIDEYRTYILTKAKQMNISIENVVVAAETDENGLCLPVSAVYTCNKPIPGEFFTAIENALGIPKERQTANETFRNIG